MASCIASGESRTIAASSAKRRIPTERWEGRPGGTTINFHTYEK
jgi:hypothetical protein